MRRFRDLLCSLIYCVEIQVSSPGAGMHGVSDLCKSSSSSVVQYDDDDMDPISESLLSSGTRRQAMLTSDTLTGTSDSRGNKSSGDQNISQSNMLIKTRLMFSANDNHSTTQDSVEVDRTQDSVEVEWMRCKMPETEATPLRGSVRFQYPMEDEEDGGAETGAGDMEGRRSRLREVDATPLRSTIRFQYPIEEEGEEDGGAETGAGDMEGRRSRLREVWFQHPESAIDEAGQDVMGVEPDREALEISVKPMIEPRGYTPISKVVSRRYPINSRVKREEPTSITNAVAGPSFHDFSTAESEKDLGVRMPLQHLAAGSQGMSPTLRCLSSPRRGGEMVSLQSKQEREGKENCHLAKPNSDGSSGRGSEYATREMPISDLRPPTNDTPLKFYELSLPASRQVTPPKRLVRLVCMSLVLVCKRGTCARDSGV